MQASNAQTYAVQAVEMWRHNTTPGARVEALFPSAVEWYQEEKRELEARGKLWGHLDTTHRAKYLGLALDWAEAHGTTQEPDDGTTEARLRRMLEDEREACRHWQTESFELLKKLDEVGRALDKLKAGIR